MGLSKNISGGICLDPGAQFEKKKVVSEHKGWLGRGISGNICGSHPSEETAGRYYLSMLMVIPDKLTYGRDDNHPEIMPIGNQGERGRSKPVYSSGSGGRAV
ncbi:MAG: hypothetical protein WCK53_16205, partial [Methanomicrobiales archaeon]